MGIFSKPLSFLVVRFFTSSAFWKQVSFLWPLQHGSLLTDPPSQHLNWSRIVYAPLPAKLYFLSVF